MADQKNSLGMDAKTASWFAYLLSIISAIIVLATEKDNKTVRTHAWQSLVMGCVYVVALIIVAILNAIFMSPLDMAFAYMYGAVTVWGILDIILYIGWVVLTIICILKAVQGGIFKLPVIYDKVKDLK